MLLSPPARPCALRRALAGACWSAQSAGDSAAPLSPSAFGARLQCSRVKLRPWHCDAPPTGCNHGWRCRPWMERAPLSSEEPGVWRDVLRET